MVKKKSSKEKREIRVLLTKTENDIIKHLREKGVLPPVSAIERDIFLKKTRDKIEALKEKYNQALKEIEALKVKAKILTTSLNEPVISYTYKKPGKKITSEAIPIVVASDWHVEERVRPSSVNNLNEYNPDIAKERIRNFFRTTVKLISMYRKRSSIDTVVLALLGDLITGFIHDEYRESNFMSPLTAILFVRDEIINGINFLMSETRLKKLIVPCSYGNHGRTTKDIRHETSAENSFEQHLYYLLESYYEKNKRIEFMINNSYHTYITLFDKYTIRFHHGDHIKYRGGIGGITVPVNKSIAQWNKSISADLDVFGHYHQLIDGGNFVANGSIIGYNAFALNIKASFERPKQAFVLIEKTYGKIATHSIIL